MSYDDASRQFEENVSLTHNTNNREDNIIWNLSAGLANIAEGLNDDLSEIKGQLEDISQRLARIESK